MVVLFAPLLAVALTAPVPSPSPAPLKEIKHVTTSAFCSVFQENIKHSVEGILLNDDLFKRSEPVFSKIGHDMYYGPLVSAFGSTGPAQSGGDNPSLMLDMNRLRELGGSVVHNLEVVDKLLNDASPFPANASGDEMKRLLGLRAQLMRIAKAQNDELNVISGTSEEYIMDSLMARDVSLGGALSSNGNAPASNGVFGGGPLPRTNAHGADPELMQNSLFMNSAAGRIYQYFIESEAAEQQLEQTFVPALIEASKLCT